DADVRAAAPGRAAAPVRPRGPVAVRHDGLGRRPSPPLLARRGAGETAQGGVRGGEGRASELVRPVRVVDERPRLPPPPRPRRAVAHLRLARPALPRARRPRAARGPEHCGGGEETVTPLTRLRHPLPALRGEGRWESLLPP